MTPSPFIGAGIPAVTLQQQTKALAREAERLGVTEWELLVDKLETHGSGE
ncbi:MAG: hypothetical protein WBZ37_09275 [Mycobacterium sp.]